MAYAPRGPLDSGDRIHLQDSSGPSLVHDRARRGAVRSTTIALVSTVVFFGGLAWIVTNAPGWPAVQRSFFNGAVFAKSLPAIVGSFWVNIQLFLISEVFILVLGLLIAVLRSLPGPVFFPVRLLATVYVDVFRALPGVLIIYILGLGIPGLGLAGIPIDAFFYAVVSSHPHLLGVRLGGLPGRHRILSTRARRRPPAR